MTETESVPPFLKAIYLHHSASHGGSTDSVPPVSHGAGSPQSMGGSQPSVNQATGPIPLYLPPPTIPQLEEALVPPENFALVCSGVYRSGFPKKRNFRFLEGLHLKTVLCAPLVPKLFLTSIEHLF